MDRSEQRTRAPSRGPLRRLLEVRGVVGGAQKSARPVRLVAEDGVEVAARLVSHLTDDTPAVVLAHGFAAHSRKPAYATLADHLALRFVVLSLDLRGHGRSGGACTFGDREALDVEAAVRWFARRPVAVVGVSMGATAVIHALARGLDVAAAAVISAPAYVGRTTTAPLARIDRMWRTPWQRRLFEAVSGVRLRGPEHWNGLPHPVDLVRATSAPLLVVHGDDDHFFPADDADALAEAAGGVATVWREPPGFGHAEDGLDATFARALVRALDTALLDGRFPPRRALR